MRTVALVTGCLLLAILPVVLYASFDGGSFTVHMVLHMGTVAVAAPLLAYGLIGTGLKIPRKDVWMTPILASVVELIVVWLWHVPALRAMADASAYVSVLELFSFLVAGLLLWIACLRPGRDGEGRLAGTMGLLFTSMHMTLLGVLLALAPRPLYGGQEVSCFGIPLDASSDQQIGGVVMLVVGAASYLIGGVALLSGVLRIEVELAREDPLW
ncbi:cytochrome c oxidase assembly protein [Rhizobium sp. TRM96647]|uniref:cytochrome c oxidase assembly protein n=1 Tax=unclassified Rhizobium TaxID=2613769 RepID=UPI0021E872F0|nr:MULTISPECIES: cytochrome c oxidase assembly protein [unclassified Rhizobium]MCV3739274.1 cytochrome c oxidase assembly protein [Rhizobium sp. TRM96647]MCV3760976.1 cytochrome c oxidase assembly protein [Rhizobium sp. TRM96650]